MIPWDIPTSDEEIPRLTHIYRNQHFLVWLAAMDLESKVTDKRKNKIIMNHLHVKSKDIYILRTVQWKKIIEIAVDPKRQRGRRSTLISDPSPEQPTIYEENLPIPTCALYPPTGYLQQIQTKIQLIFISFSKFSSSTSLATDIRPTDTCCSTEIY